MSLATLKKKTNATYKNHTVNKQDRIVLFSRKAGDIKTNVLTGPTSAFTINGKLRPRSYIGKSYAFSNSPGNGSNYCCADTSRTVKPSVFSAREVMNGKKLWKKRSFTRDEIPSNFEMPSRGQLQHVYNNWVMAKENNQGSYLSGSQGLYIENKVTNSVSCCLKSNDTGPQNCNNKLCTPTRIGGRLLPFSNTAPYTKDISKGNPYSSTMYTRINKALLTNKSKFGYNKPFPYRIPMSSYETCGVKYLQANDPQVLETYFKDQNNILGTCV